MEGTTLSNQAGIILTGNWVLPSFGTPGIIQNKTAGAHGYLSTNASTHAVANAVYTDVEAFDANDVGQLWIRSPDDELGYFSLINTNSQKYLYAHGFDTENRLTVDGNTSMFPCRILFLTLFSFIYRSFQQF